MRLTSALASLAILCSATASAHEQSFTAIWVQPIAPLVSKGHILPFGFTKGLVHGLDLTGEVTPYFGDPAVCPAGARGCRSSVNGVIASLGASFGEGNPMGGKWDFGWFATPKVLFAWARETGTFGGPQFEPPYVPGTSWELGGGLDVGLEIHAPMGVYVALMLGFHVTAAYNFGNFYDSGAAMPTNPLTLINSFTTNGRGDGVGYGLNLNLVRVGFAF